jgi:Protein of unknown function (DUF1353)
MFTTRPNLQVLARPDYWAIHEGVTWWSRDLEVRLPAGFVTDLASIPHLLRNLMNVTGRSRDGAILHDALYTCQELPRSRADEALRLALIESGMSSAGARLYWLGVKIGGWWPWHRRVRRGGGVQADDFGTSADYQGFKAHGARFVTRDQELIPMSFSFEFYAASADDAAKIMAEETVPESVRQFVLAGVKAAKGPVFVKAMGHLYNGDYQVSTAQLEVRPFTVRAPKP